MWATGRGWPRTPRHIPSFFDGLPIRQVLLERPRPVVDRDVPDADVVIATWWETAEWVAALGRSKGTKVHLIQGQEGNPLWFPPEKIRRASAVYKLPLHRIAISKSLVDWLEAEHGCRGVTLVPNAVDFGLFHAPARDRQRVPTVGFVYSETPWKGLDDALEVFARLRQRLPEVRFVAFGYPKESASLPLPAGTKYHIDPPQDHIREIYAGCDVWLCSSRVEGFALPPLEAMACRCPVVATRVGGLEQVVVDGVSGYLLRVGDVDGMARRLFDVLALPGIQWRRMSDAAHAAATAYSWDDATDRLEAAVQKFLDVESSTDGPPNQA
jgi:glycosyltransferase involved in cell wall biosynthesis